jgi:hypothetical protein
VSRTNKLNVEELINRAVTAQRLAGERQTQDAFKATEKRLYAYPVICLKVENDRRFIEEIKGNGPQGYSKSVVRFSRSGMRLSADEIAEAQVMDISARIAGDEHELETIEKALGIIEGDPYAKVISHKYFDGKNDEDIAEIMCCNSSTVRRNKARLVGRLAVFLYGCEAI